MFDIGFAELLLIGVVGLLVDRPRAAYRVLCGLTLAWVNRFRRSFDQIRTEVRRELHNDEIMQNLKTESQALEQQVNARIEPVGEHEVQSLTQLAAEHHRCRAMTRTPPAAEQVRYSESTTARTTPAAHERQH